MLRCREKILQGFTPFLEPVIVQAHLVKINGNGRNSCIPDPAEGFMGFQQVFKRKAVPGRIKIDLTYIMFADGSNIGVPVLLRPDMGPLKHIDRSLVVAFRKVLFGMDGEKQAAAPAEVTDILFHLPIPQTVGYLFYALQKPVSGNRILIRNKIIEAIAPKHLEPLPGRRGCKKPVLCLCASNKHQPNQQKKDESTFHKSPAAAAF